MKIIADIHYFLESGVLDFCYLTRQTNRCRLRAHVRCSRIVAGAQISLLLPPPDTDGTLAAILAPGSGYTVGRSTPMTP